ncbi:YqaJ viral recombinase family protein [Pseudodesulfovibrio nedwellii]|nr:YqaJ viral recombinase family protein [Pseudodesulfovibrio nedwellii]
MSREQWLAQRKLGIGGSDAAAVLGISPWKTNVELWEEKTGRREEKDISDDPYVQYGVAAETYIRGLFALDFPQYEVSHTENLSEQHRKYPQLRASLDGRLFETATKCTGVLEIKVSFINSRMDREKWKGGMPQHYYTQLLHNMFVIGADFGILKARLISQWDGDLFITEKDYRIEHADKKEDVEYLIEKELAFWRMVETDTRPNLLLPEI